MAVTPWLETCELNEDGTLSSPHYAFAYVTIGFENTGDEATGFLSGEYAMGQYDTDGCPLICPSARPTSES